MRLIRLELTGYRNLRDQRLEFPPGGVAIVGANAQGKTNLLEAIHYLETFRSFRGARDEQLVRFGEDTFRVEGTVGGKGWRAPVAPSPEPEIHPGVVATLSAAFRASTREKRVRVDGEIVPRIAGAIGGLGSVLFTPDDVRLVSDGPAGRRRFLDIVLSLNDRSYLAALQRFRQALAQRSAALRRGENPGAVAAWNGALVESGSRVTAGRSAWILASNPGFRAYSAEVSGGVGSTMRYESSIPGACDGAGEHELTERYSRTLQGAAEQERRHRTTLVGPHRDELRFTIEGEGAGSDARDYGSGGQQRTVALALRLVEADTARRSRGGEPILLLDDVFAELDEDRSRRLLQLFDRLSPGQVILTAPKERDVSFRSDLLPRWSMREGVVSE
ncbi:MAG: DNA replication and repair protein RecF [Gemmatimonadota bacterium]